MERKHDFERDFEQLDIEYWTLEPARKAVRNKALATYQRARLYYDGIEQSKTQYEYDWRLDRALTHMREAVRILKKSKQKENEK